VSEPLALPPGQAVVIEFIDPAKPAQRGVLPGEFEDDPSRRTGFWFDAVGVPEQLVFGEPFRIEVVRKWLNLSTVAEIRYLADGSLEADLERRRELHEAVRQRLEQG